MYQIGDQVTIKNTHLQGVIISKRKKGYVVLINQIPTNIKEEDIAGITSSTPSSLHQTTVSYSLLDHEAFEPEIMLRHQTVSEALANLEKFIDTAICTNNKRIRIIHGKHGGVLRQAVHQYLSTCPLIKEYYLAQSYEGSYGVTIAILK